MSALQTSLGERRGEFDTHYALAHALEARIVAGEVVSIGETQLSARHLLTMKSGLVVHLYNIVESTMSQAIDMVGTAVGGIPPRRWTENALREWLREHAVARMEGSEDARLTSIHGTSLRLLAETPLGPQKLKKPSGTWSDKQIALFAQRMGIQLTLTEEMWRKIAPRPQFNDLTPLGFLADRRNAIAHGRRSFEDGAKDLTLSTVRELADVTLDYLQATSTAFQAYVDQNRFMVAVQ
jgi:hypothetical protein